MRRIRSRKTLALCACLLALSGRSPSYSGSPELGQGGLPAGVQINPYSGWSEALFLDAPRAQTEAVVVPATGGRIARYALGGENILFEQPGAEGKTLASEKNWFMVGGYQLDIGPEQGHVPAHLPLWLGQYAWQTPKANTVQVTSKPDLETGCRLQKDIRLDPKTGALHLAQRMTNIGRTPTDYCLWDRTLCKSGGFVIIPLKPKSRFPLGWAMPGKANGQDIYDGTSPASPLVQIKDGVLIAQAAGKGTKIGTDSAAGWMAYARGKLLLIKRFSVDAKGRYSDGGCTTETYLSDGVAELEVLGPDTKLAPGQSAELGETWQLMSLPTAITSFDQARAIVGRIAP